MGEEIEEYKKLAISLKDQGNNAFQLGDNHTAIDLYSQVILYFF